jgi:hypothetical protein
MAQKSMSYDRTLLLTEEENILVQDIIPPRCEVSLYFYQIPLP